MPQVSSVEENMGEFSEIVDTSDYEEASPVVVTKEEREFVENYVRGASLEESADSAGLEYVYALKLVKRPDVASLVEDAKKELEGLDELQKREGIDFLSKVIRASPIDHVNSDGEFQIDSLKKAKAPVKGMKVKYDREGVLMSTEVQFHDPMQAMKMMGDMQDWNAPTKVELGFMGGITPSIIKDIDQVDIEAEVVEDEEPKQHRLLE